MKRAYADAFIGLVMRTSPPLAWTSAKEQRAINDGLRYGRNQPRCEINLQQRSPVKLQE